ncbi:MAG: lipopolysaccharide biosynthesis protein [Burkholderiales bacterium]|nr:lipopolysaccharide biosynthesis protein [Burkholderiales bacterium]
MTQPRTADNTQEQVAQNDDIDLLEIFTRLKSRWRLLVLAPIGAGVVAFGATYLVTPTFTAAAQLMPPQQQSSASALLGSLGGLAGAVAGGALPGLKNPSDQWVGLLRSRTIADKIVDRFKLQGVYEAEYRFQARERLGSNSRISAGKDGLIDVEVDDTSPDRAAAIANAYVTELQALMTSLALSEAGQRRVFFEKQLQEARDNLITAETALKQSAISAAVVRLSPEASVSALAQLQAQVTAQEVTISVMRGSMTADNPELRRATMELAGLRDQLKRVERADPAAASQEGAAYISKFRTFKYYETLFELIARQYELAKSDEARDGALVQVIDPAMPPELKSKPKRVLTSIVTLAGVFVACMLWALMGAKGRKRAIAPINTLELQKH